MPKAMGIKYNNYCKLFQLQRDYKIKLFENDFFAKFFSSFPSHEEVLKFHTLHALSLINTVPPTNAV